MQAWVSMLFHWPIYLFSCQYNTVLTAVALLYSLKWGSILITGSVTVKAVQHAYNILNVPKHK